MLTKKTKQPRKLNKSKSKKQRTFTSSEFSLPEDRNHLSLNELFRNDLLKRKAQPKPTKSQKQLAATKKRTKSKSKFKLDKCETYEVIPYKNSFNSEIIFSNEYTKREGCQEDSSSEQVAIRVNQQYLLDSNRQLRISIKKEYQKKVQAAIKIQKVFRGYLTRKILLKYVQQEQKILSERLAHHKSQSVSEHSSYFAEKSQDSSKHRVNSEQQGVFQFSNQKENEEEESQEELDTAVWRHHEPIYSQEEISGYLSSSEEEDFDEDAFNNHIIFQTNEQYIDSRKSSGQQQQPKNKLSRTGHPQTISEEPPETPTNPSNPVQAEKFNLSKTQKKMDRERIRGKKEDDDIREDTLKLSEEADKSTAAFPQFLERAECEATLKEAEVIMRKGSKKCVEVEAQSIQKLKEAQKLKWDEIIVLVQSQISRSSPDSSDINDFMKKIMEMSIKNKELLELDPEALHSSSHSSLGHENSIHSIDSRHKLRSIKADRLYLTHQEQKQSVKEDGNLFNGPLRGSIQEAGGIEEKHSQGIQPEKKKQGVTLSAQSLFFQEGQEEKKQTQKGSNAAVSFHSPISSFENTGQMKKFLSGNIQDEHIDQMLRLREDFIRKRELQELKQLNLSLDRKAISHEEFETQVERIIFKYSSEKTCIEKTKEDISKGYQAALKLTKEAFHDAKRLGYNLPISRSMEGIRFKSPLLIGDVIIDELVQIKSQDNRQKMEKEDVKDSNSQIKIGVESDRQSSDLEFTEEELKRFRRAQPYDIQLAEEIADMGRNVMISEELFRQQQLEEEQDQNILMKTQHVFREIYQIEEASPQQKNDPQIEIITQKMMEWVVLEVVGELLVKPLFSERLIDKNHFFKPKPVSDKERLRFIELLEQHFPQILDLNSKLNQKICPLPTQLLRCMRIDFSEDDDDDNSYQEIGKYEFIIGQEICNEAIKAFLKQIDQEHPHAKPALADLKQLEAEFPLNERVVKYVEQRQKYLANRKNHTKQLRWQVLNIEIHCIFDAWNQELIYLRSQKAGYSGIGLNQLTLSVKDHNYLVPMEETSNIVQEGKKRLIKNLSQSSPSIIFPLVMEEDEEEQMEQDSRWIFYADEALSYGLELVYLIEEEIFSEVGKQLRKRMLQFFPM